MAFRFVAVFLLSINPNVLAASLKPASALPDSPEKKPLPATPPDAPEKKPPMEEDQPVVRTHSHQAHADEIVAQAPKIPSPVLRVHHHHHMDSLAVDEKGNSQTFEGPELEVPPVVYQDQPRTPIVINSNLKPASNQSVPVEPAPSPVVRAESHPAQHDAAVASQEKPHVSEVIGVTGEAVQSKQSTKGMALEEAPEATSEIPGKVEYSPTVRAEPHPAALAQMSGQWPPRGAAAETHVVLVFLGLGLAAFVLAASGVCGGFGNEGKETKAPRTSEDILAEVYAAASHPGVTLAVPSNLGSGAVETLQL